MLRLKSRKAAGELDAPSASSLRKRPGAEGGARSEAERVYGEIFDAAMDRRLLPGAKLTEATLCSIFSCSRATVRAALSQLAHDKIVVIEPNRGAYVWQATPKETRDVFAMRQALECIVIDALAARPGIAEVLRPLHDMVDREQRAFETGDRISWIRLSNAFHVELARLADNQVLTEMLHGLCARTTLIIAFHDTPGDTACSYVEHREVLDLIARGDAPGAREAMRHHLQDCEQRMGEAAGGVPDPWAAFSVKI